MRSNRRDFIKHSAATGAGVTLGALTGAAGPARIARAQQPRRGRDVNSQPTIAAIGVGGSRGAYSQGGGIARRAAGHGRMIAVCDVDAVHMAEFDNDFKNKLAMYADYRQLLEREKPDIVTIGTPDHWHVAIAITALRSGCDVYCEKPLTLTIDEGKQICQAVKDTGRVFQVGTQQRSENDARFLKAIVIAKSGRLGKIVNAYAAVGGGTVGGPFENTKPPEGLNWDMWVGPAQKADYSIERRKEFRWYYDYSGGKMTDWGAHHIDIAQWALGNDRTGPVKISGKGKFTPIVPDKFEWTAYFAGKASLPNGYHTPSEFSVDLEFADGSVLNVCDTYNRDEGDIHFPNGILLEGEEGRIYVNRERLTGKPVEDMTESEKKQLDEEVVKLYNGHEPGDHMRDFFDAVHSRGVPISDVESHHRTMTSCHLANIALMLGRGLKWDPQKQQFEGDDEATSLMSRPRRKEYSWESTTGAASASAV